MFWTLVGWYLIHTRNSGSGQWTNHKYPTTCSSCSYLPSSHLVVKILMLLTVYVALLHSTSPSLTLYSSATTSMIPELPSEPFVKQCHVRVLRASPCVSLSSFVNCVKTSMSPRVRIILLDLLPLRKQRVSPVDDIASRNGEGRKYESRTRQAQWNHERRLPSALATGSTFLCLSMSLSL